MSADETQTSYKAGDGKVVVIHTPSQTSLRTGGIVSIMPLSGATTSRVALITVQPETTSGVWGDNTYINEVDGFSVMGAFASTRSVGKTANYVKASGTLVRKFDENNNEVMAA